MTTTNKITYADAIAALSPDQVETFRTRLVTGFDDRLTLEHRKDPTADAKQKKIAAAKAKLATTQSAQVMTLAESDPGFVTRSSADNTWFNIYAIDKVADLVRAFATGQTKNEVNVAIVKSLFACVAQKITFTGELARAAVSDKIPVKDATAAKALTRHTVSASTAPTQASSTMSALEVLGIVKNTGTAQFPVWVLQDSVMTERLKEVYAMA